MASPLPDVTPTIRDGGLGIAPPQTTNICIRFGVSILGLVNTIYSASDPGTLSGLLGLGGPLAEAAAYSIAIAGGPVYCVPVNPSTYGTASAVVQTGGGGPAITVAVKNAVALQLKVILGGAVATATFQFSVDGGQTWSATTLSAATMMVPNNTLTTLAITGAVAGAFVAGDIWTISTAGVATLSGTGTGTVAISTASPVDTYSAVITVASGGVLGAGTFTYSLDGGQTTAGPLVIPTSGIFVIPNTGLVLTFAAGTYIAGVTYAFTATAASYSTTDLQAAITPVLADPRTWGLLHVVGAPSSIALAAALLASLDTQLSSAANAFRYARGFIEVPVDTDANTISGFAASASLRVGACAGYATVASPINGRKLSRSSAWVVSARAAKVPISEDLGRVATGPCIGVVSLGRDEQATPGLDAQRFCTLRTIIGRQGFYVTNGRLMAPALSDFTYLQNGRVMDVAAGVARQALLAYLNDSVRVNPADGSINEKDARNIESFVDGQLRAALTTPGYVSDVQALVNRTANILYTQTLPVTIRVIPLGYSKFISVDIGFTNPSLIVK